MQRQLEIATALDELRAIAKMGVSSIETRDIREEYKDRMDNALHVLMNVLEPIVRGDVYYLARFIDGIDCDGDPELRFDAVEGFGSAEEMGNLRIEKVSDGQNKIAALRARGITFPPPIKYAWAVHKVGEEI